MNDQFINSLKPDLPNSFAQSKSIILYWQELLFQIIFCLIFDANTFK